MEEQYYLIFNELYKQLSSLDTKLLNNIKEEILKVRQNANKVLIAGNGGSHGIASHLSVDMTKICKVKAMSFSDPTLITCLANDYGYEIALQKFIEFYNQEGDLVILISSSGESKNILNAAKEAKKNKLKLITLSGFSHNNSFLIP